ncbi:hypothetical protein [Hymenobacter metallilatus]|uniref:Uncharacterized protein n=1 Tax=Hymenobacter metallilatus TaxID=2493666 RepID=A0A428JF66_9BACT|nr:hypothetical protein [Hymenobacter metallilatus]RSK31206.1 hypothetical protein EI290_14400 [Hymenobacter metallilatus]
MTRTYYQKLVDGLGLTEAEIGGRLIMINKKVATAEQLRALPAGTVSAFSLSDTPLEQYGEAGRNGLIFVLTKDKQ